jgi:phospholipase/carboxylesterase
MSAGELIDGPRLEAASGKAESLVVFLHGYGADGADLISIGRQWAALLPASAFVAPNAPHPCDMSPMGYQWFPLRITMEGVRSSPQERWRGALSAAPFIDDFLDRELAARGLDESRLALVGFSQGAMMALHVGLRRRKCPAAIVSFSGMLLGAEHIGETSCRPPVFMAHGDMDEVVPFASLAASAEALKAAGLAVETRVERHMGHGIDMEAMELAGRFLARHLV